MHPLNINNWRDNDKNLEQLNGGCLIGYIFGCLLQCRRKRFFKVDLDESGNDCADIPE